MTPHEYQELLDAVTRIDAKTDNMAISTARLETHIENMAGNQMTLAERFNNFCTDHNDKHIDIEKRVTKTETRSGLLAIGVTAITNIAMWFGFRSLP